MDSSSGRHWSDHASGFVAAEDLVTGLSMRADATGDRGFAFRAYDSGQSGWISFADLDRRARAVASVLAERGLAHRPALLVYAPGPDFLSGFFGCLYAGTLAVPVYPPDLNRIEHALARLEAIVEDSRAACGLTVSPLLGVVESLSERSEALRSLDWLATDAAGDDRAARWRNPGIHRHSPAFIQYTSGSTGNPRGVVVTHGNLIDNCRRSYERFGWWRWPDEWHFVSWLPMYHDMGLIGIMLVPMLMGALATYMSPIDFLRRPLRWLELISEMSLYKVASGGPNFGFDLAVRAIEENPDAKLELGHWRVAYNGAEPVRLDTLARFSHRFESRGFDIEAFAPCYGLAEATLMVSGGPTPRPPVTAWVDAEALSAGHIQHVPARTESARVFVGCGSAIDDHELRIVDPESRRETGPDVLGEVWFAGSCVAREYWNDPARTEETLRASLEGGDDTPWLRTGDLGFVHDGELFLVGRLKDLIIVRGRNLHPYDVERCTEDAHPAIRPGCSAAFAVERDGGPEELGLAFEIREPDPAVAAEAVVAVRRSVARSIGVTPRIVAALPPRVLPKTSSGKIQRSRTRELLETGGFEVLAHDPSVDSHGNV